MTNLNEATQLISQERKDEARHILETILQANPQDIQAWFWYVETCSTNEQRINLLEICLKANPGNLQVLRALRALQARQCRSAPSVSSSAPPSAPSSALSSAAPAFVFDEAEPQPASLPVFETSGTG